MSGETQFVSGAPQDLTENETAFLFYNTQTTTSVVKENKFALHFHRT